MTGTFSDSENVIDFLLSNSATSCGVGQLPSHRCRVETVLQSTVRLKSLVEIDNQIIEFSHSTSAMNCCIAPSFIGPRQTTGVSSSSRRKAIEITLTPSVLEQGVFGLVQREAFAV